MADLEPAWRTSLKKHHNELRSGILIANFLPAFRLLLTDVEYIRIEEKEGRIDKVDELVKILLTKDESTFDGCCSALEANGYPHWASKLRDKGTEHIASQSTSLEVLASSSRETSATLPISPQTDNPVFCPQQQTAAALVPTRCFTAWTLDVLLLGSVGKGKSTTGNKLLNVHVANHVTDRVREGALKQVWPRDCDGTDQGNGADVCIEFDTKPGVVSVTQECKVIANAETGFRVMDTRGFVPYDATDNRQIMQEVVRISTQLGIAFHRVLYFLPERDIPERTDGNLQEELSVLWHFYGDSIFKNMVIVMTSHPRSISANPNIDTEFGEGAVIEVRQIFLEALEKAIHSHKDAKLPPCPDIIFIPLPATAESVAEIVRNAKVCEPSGIRLEFQETTCSKCGSVIHFRRKIGSASIAGAEFEDEIIRIPEESKCHPALIPKYTKLEKFVGGVGHLVTLGIPQGVYRLAGKSDTVWPWFTNSEEKCEECECAPSVKGCTKVGEMYKSIAVDHDRDVRVEDHSI